MDIAQDGNLFPREDLLEAVAQSDWREQSVPWAAWLLTAVGLGLLALGLPSLSPFAMEPTVWSAELHSGATWRGTLAHPVHWLVSALGPSLGGIESLWFLGSSLGLALGFLCLGAALRASGVGPRLAFFTALCALAAPTALGHGRLPSDFLWGIVGASILAALVSAPSDETPAGSRGYGRRVALGLLVACLCHPLNVAAAPGAWLVAHGRGGARAMVPVVLATTAFEVLVPHGDGGSAGVLFHPALDLLLLGGSLWLMLPRAWAGEREESPPPSWLSLWLLGGLGVSGASALTGGSPSPAIVPAVALLSAGSLARYARPDNAARRAAGLMGLQAVLIGAGAVWLSARAPYGDVAGLSTQGPGLFEPGDVLWVSAEEAQGPAAFLVRRRFGVPVLLEREADSDPLGRDMSLLGSPLVTPWKLNARGGVIAPHE